MCEGETPVQVILFNKVSNRGRATVGLRELSTVL